MKKLFLLLIIAASIAIAPAAHSQEQKDPKKDRTEWERKVKEELKLNTDQAVKFDAVCKEYNDKIDAVVQDASLNKDIQKERKTALKKEKETKVLEILTPEQQATYKELMEKKKKEMSEKPQPNN